MAARKKHLSPKTIQRARQLRKDSTSPERLLWSVLRNRKLDGLKFRRQHPIGPYFTDFFCEEAGLIIEIDGESHIGQEQKDHQRQAWLESQGYQVFRVTTCSMMWRMLR